MLFRIVSLKCKAWRSSRPIPSAIHSCRSENTMESVVVM